MRVREPPTTAALSCGSGAGAASVRVVGNVDLLGGQKWADPGNAGMLQVAFPRNLSWIQDPAVLVGWAAQAPDWEGRLGWRVAVAAVLPGFSHSKAEVMVQAAQRYSALLGDSGRKPPTIVGVIVPSVEGKGGEARTTEETYAMYESLTGPCGGFYMVLGNSRRGALSFPLPLAIFVAGKDIVPTSTQILLYGAPGPRGVCHHYERQQLRLSASGPIVANGPCGHGFVAWAVFYINAAPILSRALTLAERARNSVEFTISKNHIDYGGRFKRVCWARAEQSLTKLAQELVDQASGPSTFLCVLCRWSAFARILLVKLRFLIASPQKGGRLSAEEEALVGICFRLGSASNQMAVAYDALLGLVLGLLLLRFSGTVEMVVIQSLEWLEHVGIRESVASFLQNPGGMKLNGPLNAEYSCLVDYVLKVATEVGELIQLPRMELGGNSWSHLALSIGCSFGASGLLAASADLVGILTWPITLLHAIFSLVLRFQIAAWSWCLRVFQGKKWNVIRQRYYEGHEVRIEQRVIGTILFVINSLLLPTTLVYHLHAVVLRLACYGLARSLLGLAIFIATAPFLAVMAVYVRGAKAAPQGIAIFPINFVMEGERQSIRPDKNRTSDVMKSRSRAPSAALGQDNAHGRKLIGVPSAASHNGPLIGEATMPNLDPTYLILHSLCAPVQGILAPMWKNLHAECGPGPFSALSRALVGRHQIPISPCANS